MSIALAFALAITMDVGLWFEQNMLKPYLDNMKASASLQREEPKDFQATFVMQCVHRTILYANRSQPPVPRPVCCRDGAVSIAEILLHLGWDSKELAIAVVSPKENLWQLGYYLNHVVILWDGDKVIDSTGDIARWPIQWESLKSSWELIGKVNLSEIR